MTPDENELDNETTFAVTCPYCAEPGALYLEPDVSGTLVHDCEVCCQPWRVDVAWEDGRRFVAVSRGDGSE